MIISYNLLEKFILFSVCRDSLYVCELDSPCAKKNKNKNKYIKIITTYYFKHLFKIINYVTNNKFTI